MGWLVDQLLGCMMKSDGLGLGGKIARGFYYLGTSSSNILLDGGEARKTVPA